MTGKDLLANFGGRGKEFVFNLANPVSLGFYRPLITHAIVAVQAGFAKHVLAR